MSEGTRILGTADIAIGGNIQTETNIGDGFAESIGLNVSGTANVFVGGKVSTTSSSENGNASAIGILASATNDDDNIDITVKDGVAVRMASNYQDQEITGDPFITYNLIGEDRYPTASGLDLTALDGTITANITGDVTVQETINGDPGFHNSAVSITAGSLDNQSYLKLEDGTIITEAEYLDWINSKTGILEKNSHLGYESMSATPVNMLNDNVRSVEINVNILEDEAGNGGNISADEYGLVVAFYGAVENKNDGEKAPVTVTVEGEISAGVAGIIVNENVTEENLSLTVWKVSLAEINGEEHAVATLTDDFEAENRLTTTEETEKIEKAINYIIKVEDTENLKASADTAREGETVTLEINVPAGYHLNGAFNGIGQKVALQQDANGNYYVIVPRGGGVYLSAQFDADVVPSDDDDDNNDDDNNNRPVITIRTVDSTDSKLPNVYIEGSSKEISAEEAELLSRFSPEQQVAIILTKLGMKDALKSSEIRVKDLAKDAAELIKSDLSGLVTTETLTIDGETTEWIVIKVWNHGKLVRYCFRKLDDGTWIFRVV